MTERDGAALDAEGSALRVTAPSGVDYWAFLRPSSPRGMKAEFSGLQDFQPQDLSALDDLLAIVLGRAFIDHHSDSLIMHGDSPGAETLFKGLGELVRTDGQTRCEIDREKYLRLRS